MQHHKGNADRPDKKGDTVDWISIYKHGHDGEAEHPLKYTFLSFFREDPKTVLRELRPKNPREALWGVIELALFVSTFVVLGILNWHYICFLLFFWYFGHCLSYLNGYYRHYGGNPNEPIAWGVRATTSSITGSGSTTAIMRSIISGRKCIGRGCARSAIRSSINSVLPEFG